MKTFNDILRESRDEKYVCVGRNRSGFPLRWTGDTLQELEQQMIIWLQGHTHGKKKIPLNMVLIENPSDLEELCNFLVDDLDEKEFIGKNPPINFKVLRPGEELDSGNFGN